MFDRLATAIAQLERCFDDIDPRLLDGAQAARLVEHCTHVDRVVASVKLRAARRVEETKAYSQTGHRSAAGWLADVTGTSTGQAANSLNTAQQLADLPATAAALAGGLISEAEARHIASAASVDRAAEADLLRAAQHESHRRLQEQAARRRAAAQGDEDRDERLHANRQLRDWTDGDGATCVRLQLPPADGARLLAAVDARAEQIFQDASRAGRRERLAAYRADALLALVDGAANVAASGAAHVGGRALDTCVNVLIDYAALVRGRTEAGERCDIPGVGPISVSTARRLLSDSILKLIITDGIDVYNVTHAGRTIPAHLRTALLVRDQECCKPGCGERARLEIHHFSIDYANAPEARLANLARLCHYHHRQVSLGRSRLSGGPGQWAWVDEVPATARSA